MYSPWGKRTSAKKSGPSGQGRMTDLSHFFGPIRAADTPPSRFPGIAALPRNFGDRENLFPPESVGELNASD